MGIMKSVDLVLSNYKLSDAQKNAVVEIYGGGTNPINARTLKSLEKRGLIEMRLDGWSLSDTLTDEIRVAVRTPEPREEIQPDETVALTGSYSGGHSQEEIMAAFGEEDTQEVQESVEPEVFIPRFNRKMLRDLRRSQARANRRRMYDQGKRTRKYGADDPQYFRRKYLRVLSKTENTVNAA
jgi:hypothetical protein